MPKISAILLLLVAICLVGLVLIQDRTNNDLGQPRSSPEVVLPEPITTADAIRYIVQGQEILDMARDAFEEQQSSSMALTLSQIYLEYVDILDILCEVEGTSEACVSAYNSLTLTYTALYTFSNQ